MRTKTVSYSFSQDIFRVVFIYGVIVILTFLILSIFLALLNYDVPKALRTLTTTAFKSSFGFQGCMKKTIPLIFTSYAFAIPFTMRFFNIGAWGQMLVGGAISAIVGLSLGRVGLPSYIMIPIVLAAGILAGGILGWAAGWLKACHDINPIVSTIMLNFIAFLFVNFITSVRPFSDPNEGHPMTYRLPDSALLGYVGGIPHSIILAFVAFILVYVLLRRTRLGYEITSVGYNLVASQVYGIDFKKTIMIAFFIGGAFAGLGGCLEVINIHGRLVEGFEQTSGAQFGVFGILVSLIVAGNPAGVPITAFLMSVLLIGADALQRTMQIPVEVIFLSQAFIVLTIVILRRKMLGEVY